MQLYLTHLDILVPMHREVVRKTAIRLMFVYINKVKQAIIFSCTLNSWLFKKAIYMLK